MITYHINDIRPVAQQVCDQLAGRWFIISNHKPYVLAEDVSISEASEIDLDELEALQIIEDNIRNGDGLSE